MRLYNAMYHRCKTAHLLCVNVLPKLGHPLVPQVVSLYLHLLPTAQALRMQWESISPAQASRNDHWRERCTRINKDARRTDRYVVGDSVTAAEQCGKHHRAFLLTEGIQWVS